jgi:hypothetical protein
MNILNDKFEEVERFDDDNDNCVDSNLTPFHDKLDRVGFEQSFFLSIIGIAEVVGSTPTRSISSILVKYGIKLGLF